MSNSTNLLYINKQKIAKRKGLHAAGNGCKLPQIAVNGQKWPQMVVISCLLWIQAPIKHQSSLIRA